MASLANDPWFLLALLAGPLVLGGFALWLEVARFPGLWADSPWQFVLLCMLLPSLEEAVFRGLLQKQLLGEWTGQLAGLSHANIVAAGAFALSHLLYHPPLWALATLVPGLVFGFFMDRYRHLLPCILLHAFYNSGYYLLYNPLS